MALTTALQNLQGSTSGKQQSVIEQNRLALDFIRLRSRIKNNINVAVYGTPDEDGSNHQRVKLLA